MRLGKCQHGARCHPKKQLQASRVKLSAAGPGGIWLIASQSWLRLRSRDSGCWPRPFSSLLFWYLRVGIRELKQMFSFVHWETESLRKFSSQIIRHLLTTVQENEDFLGFHQLVHWGEPALQEPSGRLGMCNSVMLCTWPWLWCCQLGWDQATSYFQIQEKFWWDGHLSIKSSTQWPTPTPSNTFQICHQRSHLRLRPHHSRGEIIRGVSRAFISNNSLAMDIYTWNHMPLKSCCGRSQLSTLCSSIKCLLKPCLTWMITFR